MAKRSHDKVNAMCGLAAISALVAALLIVSNSDLVLKLLSSFVIEMPPGFGVQDIIQQLAQIKVTLPNSAERSVIFAIAGFLAISITSTVAAAKIRR